MHFKTHSDGLSQFCMAPKYTATGCRKFATAQNTQRRAVADFATLEIHSDEPSQLCMAPKYAATGCRKFATAQNTQRRAVAALHGPEIHSDGLAQTCGAALISHRWLRDEAPAPFYLELRLTFAAAKP